MSERLTPQEIVGNWLKDRPIMQDNNDFHQVIQLLTGEVQELIEAYQGGDRKDIAQEVADVFIFCYTLANILEVDAEDEVREKMAYNMTRYISANFQSGDYSEARKKSRDWVKDNNWKGEFYSI